MDLELILTLDPQTDISVVENLGLKVSINDPLPGFKSEYNGFLLNMYKADDFIRLLIINAGMVRNKHKLETVRNEGFSYYRGIPDEESPGRRIYRFHFYDEEEIPNLKLLEVRTKSLQYELERLARARDKSYFIAQRNEWVDEPSWRSFHGRGSKFGRSNYRESDFPELIMQLAYEIRAGQLINEDEPYVYLREVEVSSQVSVQADKSIESECKKFVQHELLPLIKTYVAWKKKNTKMDEATSLQLMEMHRKVSGFMQKYGLASIVRDYDLRNDRTTFTFIR